MTAYSVAAFHVITGVCVLAAVRHMSNGFWRPIDKSNLLFSVMCCCAAGMAWTQAQIYQSWSIEEHGTLLKWNVSFAFVFKDLQEPPKEGVVPGRMFVKFKGEGLTLKPFTYRPNLAEIYQKLQRPPAEKPAPKPSEPGKPAEPVKPAEPAKPGTDKPMEPGK